MRQRLLLLAIVFAFAPTAARAGDARSNRADVARYRQQVARTRAATAVKAWLGTPGGPPGMRRLLSKAKAAIEARRDREGYDDEEGMIFGGRFVLVADGTLGGVRGHLWDYLRVADLEGATRASFRADFRQALGELLGGKPLDRIYPEDDVGDPP